MKISTNAILLSLIIPSAWSWTSSSNKSRREIFQQTSAAIFGASTANILLNIPSASSSSPASIFTPPSSFAETLPSAKDLEKLQRGHSRVRYLLENWDAITETCGKGVMSDLERKQVIRTEGGGGGFCEKTPLNVQDYLGYKSTKDPLFKADKLMVKAAPLVDPDFFEEYLDVVERYREKADQGAMMAYTSSWGEANPGGGKEIIDEYLESTKDEVMKTELLLKSVLGYLNLEVLPISKDM